MFTGTEKGPVRVKCGLCDCVGITAAVPQIADDFGRRSKSAALGQERKSSALSASRVDQPSSFRFRAAARGGLTPSRRDALCGISTGPNKARWIGRTEAADANEAIEAATVTYARTSTS
jgi:hypothetical protein